MQWHKMAMLGMGEVLIVDPEVCASILPQLAMSSVQVATTGVTSSVRQQLLQDSSACSVTTNSQLMKMLYTIEKEQ